MTKTSISLGDLREANIARQLEWCADKMPDLMFRAVELAGETGEALNVVKKLERERMSWAGSRATLDDLASELADIIIAADLLALTAGLDLGKAVERKFNATSEKLGLVTRLIAKLPDKRSDEPDWWYRYYDHDNSGDSPHEALSHVGDGNVCLLHSAYHGPSKWAFRAQTLATDDDETEVLLFDSKDEAIAASKERMTALEALAQTDGDKPR